LEWSKGNGVRILVIEAKIANDARTPAVLRNHTKGGDTQMRELFNGGVWEDSPKTLVDEVNHFFREEVQKLLTGTVGTTYCRLLDAGW
jgi:hypothetical protein